MHQPTTTALSALRLIPSSLPQPQGAIKADGEQQVGVAVIAQASHVLVVCRQQRHSGG